jgi:hypothetical protein
MTQKTDLLDYLERHGSITRLEAFTDLGIAELASRVGELERDGIEIPRKRIEVTARNNRKCHVTQYLRPTIQRELAI